MMKSTTVSAHIFMVPLAEWGHTKTLITFACRLLQALPSTMITFTAVGDFKHLAECEVEQHFINKDVSPKRNLRILDLGGEGRNILELEMHRKAVFHSVCSSLFLSEPIKCNNGLVFENSRRPDLAICDIILFDVYRTVREVSNFKVPILTWNSPGTAGIMRLLGPEALGGLGDISAKAMSLAASENLKPLIEIETELSRPAKGEVLEMLGGVTIYDYELFPQKQEEEPSFVAAVQLYIEGYKTLMNCDGVLFSGNVAFEPEASRVCKEWCHEVGKSCYVVGPLLLEEDQLEVIGKTGKINPEVQQFLDRIYASHGRHSLLYISFGSLFWPSGEAIWEVLKVVWEMKIPTVLAYGLSRHGEMPSKLKECLELSEIILVSAWTPQELILNHQATGWFMTHCGHGSITESISHSVPLIAWPIYAEQPYHATYAATVLNIAYELLEVRRGLGLKPLYRSAKPTGTSEAVVNEAREVLTKAFGKDGEEKRRNVEALGKRMNTLWREGGEALEDMKRFIADYFPGDNMKSEH